MSGSPHRVDIDPVSFDAAIFDMDGVITQTAMVHAEAWKRLFDDYRSERLRRRQPAFEPFDIDQDYRLYVDGRPRYDGVGAFLASRSITLPFGAPTDPPGTETVCGLGNTKDAYFWERIHRDGVRTYASTLALIRQLKDQGLRVGVFSASRNAAAVLRVAGVLDMFDGKVDGTDSERLGLRGKPDPAMLLELAHRLGADPRRTIVFEDAIAGVQAGRAGGFGVVIGVNRKAETGALLERGADREVCDLSEIVLSG